MSAEHDSERPLEERARALAMARLTEQIEKAKGKVVLIDTHATHLRRAYTDIQFADKVLRETEEALKATETHPAPERVRDFPGRPLEPTTPTCLTCGAAVKPCSGNHWHHVEQPAEPHFPSVKETPA